MMPHEITGQVGARRRRKRLGRGISAGKGKTCGKGTKGEKARSGNDLHPLYEGGQMPIFRRVAKRGFSNAKFRQRHEIVRLADLSRFDDGATVTPAALREQHLVEGTNATIKVVATGALEKKLTVEAHAFSAQARAAIEQRGGTAKLIAAPTAAEKAKAKRFSTTGGKKAVKPA